MDAGSCVSWVSFWRSALCRRTLHEERAASCCSLVILDRPLVLAGNDLGALEDAKSVGILRAIQEGCDALYAEHQGKFGKSLRTKLNLVKANVDSAISVACSPEVPSSLSRRFGTIPIGDLLSLHARNLQMTDVHEYRWFDCKRSKK